MRRMPTGEQIDKIEQAYSLSVTNEKDISTLDGQVAELEQKAITGIKVYDKFSSPALQTIDTIAFAPTKYDISASIVTGTMLMMPAPATKTLFGNQSVLGEGNIDLYRHNVQIRQGTTGSESFIYTTLYSSKNTPIDSITDLKTMLNLSAAETYPAHGMVQSGQAALYLQAVGSNLTVNYMTGSMTSETLSSGVVSDKIKTI